MCVKYTPFYRQVLQMHHLAFLGGLPWQSREYSQRFCRKLKVRILRQGDCLPVYWMSSRSSKPGYQGSPWRRESRQSCLLFLCQENKEKFHHHLSGFPEVFTNTGTNRLTWNECNSRFHSFVRYLKIVLNSPQTLLNSSFQEWIALSYQESNWKVTTVCF